MYFYTLRQWLLFFYTYCFFGWIFESSYVSILKRKLTNRGFMRGPFLPIYGSGAIVCLFVTIPFRGNYVAMYLAGAVAATLLEYVTGVVMEALFKVRYWDYSNQRFQFQGHICLSSTIAWGFLGVFLVEIIHKPIENFWFKIGSYWDGYLEEMIVIGLTIYFVADFTMAFRDAYELRDLLIQLEQKMHDVKAKAHLYRETLSEHHIRMVHRIATTNPSLHSVRFKHVLDELKEMVKAKRKEL